MTFPNDTDSDDPRMTRSEYDDDLSTDEDDDMYTAESVESADSTANSATDSVDDILGLGYDPDAEDSSDEAEAAVGSNIQSYAYRAATESTLIESGLGSESDLNADSSADSSAVSDDDDGAASDLPRENRADLFQAERRSQFSMFTLALMMVAFGAGVLVDLFTPESELLTPPLLIGVGAVGLSVGLLGRYLINGRREIGLLFLGLAVGIALVLGVAFGAGVFDPAAIIPLTIVAFGLTLILLIFFGARERGLLLPGLIVCVVGAVLLPYALGLIPASLFETVRTYYPALIVAAGLLLIPVALRRRA